MEKLQAYVDFSSDSDSEHQDDNAQEISTSETVSSNLTSSSFGFSPHTHESYPSVIRSQQKEASNFNGNLEESKIDVPDGDFWKNFVPDPNSTQVHNKLSKTNMRNSSIGSVSKTTPFKYEGRKRPHINEKQSNQKTKCTHPSRLEDHHTLSSSQPTEKQEKRKMFYVHSKVSPYLNSSCYCKCALKSNSSWLSHNKAINRIMWNKPNYSHLLLSAGMDSLIKVWNVWSTLDRCVATVNHHSKAVRHALWGFQGRDIISCSYDKTAIVTDLESGRIKSRYIHPGYVFACALHPNNFNCFITGTENLIQLWDQRTPLSPARVFVFKDKLGQPQDLLFINNGAELISCNDVVSKDSADRTIMAWDIKSGNVISNQIYQERYTCTRLKQSPSDSFFLAQTQGGYVALFSTNHPYKMNRSKRFEGHQMQGYNIGFDLSQDGRVVYSGSAEGGVHCYDYVSGRQIRKCSMERNDVIVDVASHPVLPTLVASCSWGGTITLWE